MSSYWQNVLNVANSEYQEAKIGVTGYNFYNISGRRPGYLVKTDYRDVMCYDEPQNKWISDYNYSQIFKTFWIKAPRPSQPTIP